MSEKTTPGTAGGHTELFLGALEETRVTLVSSPLATLLSLVADVYGGRRQGVPAAWRRRFSAGSYKAGKAIVRPMFMPKTSIVPDCLAPMSPGDGMDVESGLERITEVTADQMVADLTAAYGTVPQWWLPIADAPRPWLLSYTKLLRDVWALFEPVWRRAEPFINAEAERIGVAVIRGGIETILASLNPRARFADNTLYLPDPQPARFDLAERRLTLVPLVSGTDASVSAFDDPAMIWFGYPLPSIGRLVDTTPERRAQRDRLDLVLGTMRARILRFVAVPATMLEIAAEVGCAPATATYHCRPLAASGLVTRERRGNHVRIRRTARGDTMVDLIS